VRQSQGTQEKGVAAKVTSPQRQDVCSAPITRHQRVGITGPESIWVYTETIE